MKSTTIATLISTAAAFAEPQILGGSGGLGGLGGLGSLSDTLSAITGLVNGKGVKGSVFAKLLKSKDPNCKDPPAEFNDLMFGGPVAVDPTAIPAGCNPLEVIIARGTSEPNAPNGGHFGRIVGDPLIGNLTAKLGADKVRGYPVQYVASASIDSFEQGSTDIVKRVASQTTACPDQKLVLVGYSQGASITHIAASQIPAAQQAKIIALVMYGDPALKANSTNSSAGGLAGLGSLDLTSIAKFAKFLPGSLGSKFSDPAVLAKAQAANAPFPGELPSKLQEVCAKGDPVCDGGDCFYNHLTYIEPQNIAKGVDHIVAKFNAA